MAVGDFVRSRTNSTRASPRTNSSSISRAGDGASSSFAACAASDGEDDDVMDVPLLDSNRKQQPSSNSSNNNSNKRRIAKRLLHRLRLCLRLQHHHATTTHNKKRRWIVLVLLCFLLFIVLLGSSSSSSTRKEVLHVLGVKQMTHQEKFKKRLNAELARKEKEHAKRHKPSQHRPWEELILEKSRTDLLQTIVQDELQKITEMPFVSWGVYHMYRSAFPPEINMPNVKGDQSYPVGHPPAAQKLRDNQVLIAHRVPNPKRLDYSLPHWEERIRKDRVKNIGIYLMGDEFDYGSSFLNDELDGDGGGTAAAAAASRSCPFSFLIRDYYFDPLQNAKYTKVVQLGTMTCQRKKLACSVKPPDAVFVNMLPSAVKLELRPKTIVKASERTRKCYWAGSDRNDRKQMVEYFEKEGGCEVYLTPGFNQGHNKTVYAEILADSAFGLVPSGNSPETHRLAEVLMFGGIPVMLDQDAQAAYLHSYAEPIPMITGRTWQQANQRMQALSSDDLDKLQQTVLQWWDRHWDCVHADLRWILAQAHAVSEGRDLCSSFHTEVEKRLQWLRWGKKK